MYSNNDSNNPRVLPTGRDVKEQQAQREDVGRGPRQEVARQLGVGVGEAAPLGLRRPSDHAGDPKVQKLRPRPHVVRLDHDVVGLHVAVNDRRHLRVQVDERPADALPDADLLGGAQSRICRIRRAGGEGFQSLPLDLLQHDLDVVLRRVDHRAVEEHDVWVTHVPQDAALVEDRLVEGAPVSLAEGAPVTVELHGDRAAAVAALDDEPERAAPEDRVVVDGQLPSLYEPVLLRAQDLHYYYDYHYYCYYYYYYYYCYY